RGAGRLSPSVVPPFPFCPHPFDPLSLRERGDLVRPSFPFVLTPLIPSPCGRGETQPVLRSPSPEGRGGQGVRTETGTGGEDRGADRGARTVARRGRVTWAIGPRTTRNPAASSTPAPAAA